MRPTSNKGLHILLTLQTELVYLLLDSIQFLEFITNVLETKDVEVVGVTNHNFDNNSFTSAVCLKESHLCIHTWPEFNQLTFDVFLCNYTQDNTQKVEQIAAEVISYFNAQILQENKIYR